MLIRYLYQDDLCSVPVKLPSTPSPRSPPSLNLHPISLDRDEYVDLRWTIFRLTSGQSAKAGAQFGHMCGEHVIINSDCSSGLNVSLGAIEKFTRQRRRVYLFRLTEPQEQRGCKQRKTYFAKRTGLHPPSRCCCCCAADVSVLRKCLLAVGI